MQVPLQDETRQGTIKQGRGKNLGNPRTVTSYYVYEHFTETREYSEVGNETNLPLNIPGNEDWVCSSEGRVLALQPQSLIRPPAPYKPGVVALACNHRQGQQGQEFKVISDSIVSSTPI